MFIKLDTSWRYSGAECIREELKLRIHHFCRVVTLDYPDPDIIMYRDEARTIPTDTRVLVKVLLPITL